jgi:hypothetical protein
MYDFVINNGGWAGMGYLPAWQSVQPNAGSGDSGRGAGGGGGGAPSNEWGWDESKPQWPKSPSTRAQPFKQCFDGG